MLNILFEVKNILKRRVRVMQFYLSADKLMKYYEKIVDDSQKYYRTSFKRR